jgi:hypothetical protein
MVEQVAAIERFERAIGKMNEAAFLAVNDTRH